MVGSPVNLDIKKSLGWFINLGFGKNNLVPTVTASFDALEAGGTVEGLFDFMGRLFEASTLCCP
eukprot:scaffold93826_cov111-Phaeocystis_antarctica.AAC.1